ncbi:zincin-like metallopeptidase domain-containing protein [Bradyrhizobium sp. DASA03005]|uniref:zincin-like metallopeptidase domain-containing protein n=1 Tax=Bradyrhizobium sp. SPXBL-02 TaxID=3395912 RepID=UPI003F6F2B93
MDSYALHRFLSRRRERLREHECTHCTQHEKHLDREFGRKRFGDAGYAMEELVAELGVGLLSADLGLTPEVREDHAFYSTSWIKVLKNDKRAIFTESSHAQRAADFLQAFQVKNSAVA